jgi:hypothetical protein
MASVSSHLQIVFFSSPRSFPRSRTSQDLFFHFFLVSLWLNMLLFPVSNGWGEAIAAVGNGICCVFPFLKATGEIPLVLA